MPFPEHWSDILVGLVGALGVCARIARSFATINAQSQLPLYAMIALSYLLMTVIPWAVPSWFRRHRTTLLVVVVVLCCVLPQLSFTLRHQVILSHTSPTDNLAKDMFLALLGLRLVARTVTGLVQLPPALWLSLQLLLLFCSSNLEVDCQTKLLSHPIMAGRISVLHQAMQHLVALVFPMAPRLYPEGQLEQCKAAVTFTTVVLGVVFPAMVLLTPEPSTAAAAAGARVAAAEEARAAPRHQRHQGIKGVPSLLQDWGRELRLRAAALGRRANAAVDASMRSLTPCACGLRRRMPLVGLVVVLVHVCLRWLLLVCLVWGASVQVFH